MFLFGSKFLQSSKVIVDRYVQSERRILSPINTRRSSSQGLTDADYQWFRSADTEIFDRAYFQSGTKSCYRDYRPMPELNAARASAIINAFQLRPSSSKVLDVGCAYGYLVNALREAGIEAKGIDVSSHAIARSIEDAQASAPFLPRAGQSTFQLLHSAETLQSIKSSDSFDLVLLKDILEHVPPDILPRFLRSVGFPTIFSEL